MTISRKKLLENRKRKQDAYLIDPSICAVCAKIMPYTRKPNRCCSYKCGAIYCRFQKYEARRRRWISGLEPILDRRLLKKYVIDIKGEKCEREGCAVTEQWLGKPIILTIEHKDGNAGNDLPENIQLLCPNCHSQTSTYCGKNKGRGRRARGLSANH
jgi:hypothetical protein